MLIYNIATNLEQSKYVNFYIDQFFKKIVNFKKLLRTACLVWGRLTVRELHTKYSLIKKLRKTTQLKAKSPFFETQKLGRIRRKLRRSVGRPISSPCNNILIKFRAFIYFDLMIPLWSNLITLKSKLISFKIKIEKCLENKKNAQVFIRAIWVSQIDNLIIRLSCPRPIIFKIIWTGPIKISHDRRPREKRHGLSWLIPPFLTPHSPFFPPPPLLLCSSLFVRFLLLFTLLLSAQPQGFALASSASSSTLHSSVGTVQGIKLFIFLIF